MKFIDLDKQYRLIESDVLAGIQRVLNHGQYIMGPEIEELERQLASFIGVKHAIVNASGTDALLMSLLALEINAGDEVITTPFSFFATAEVLALLGIKPVFVDINPSTYNIDVSKIKAAITSKTKAIMPVSLYGQCADMTDINKIANEHGLSVIEDAAQSFGATYKGEFSGALSTISATSFFPSKPLGGYGDSGACFTNDDRLNQILREIRVHGQSARYKHSRIGITGRMDTIQAAILLEKLKLFPDEIALRQRVGARYDSLLSGLVTTPTILPGNTSAYAQYTIELDNRDVVQARLQSKGIPTAVHYPIALHQQEALLYLNYKTGDFPISERAATRVISLPMHPYLSEEEQVQVVDALKDALKDAL